MLYEVITHANIVPWQMLCERKGAILKVIPFDDRGVLQMDMLPGLFTPRTRILSVAHISNTLGTINPIKDIIAMAHTRGVQVVIDAAQSIQHAAIDVQALDADYLVFSGHRNNFV